MYCPRARWRQRTARRAATRDREASRTCVATPDRSPRPESRLVLERQPHFRAIALDLAILELAIELLHLGHAQVTQGLARTLDGRLRGLFPRLRRRADQLDDLVHALPHTPSPLDCPRRDGLREL